MSALIPVNSTVSVNDFMNGYFDSVSTVDNIGETDKLLLVQNGELKAASGDNLVSETTIENNFASWANSYLPIGSTATPSLISGAQSQKLANLTTATATSGTKGYMSAADKAKLDNLTTYTRVGGSNTQDGLVNAIATTYENPRFFSIAPGANVAGWHDGIVNTELLATTAHSGLMSAADKESLDITKSVLISLEYIQDEYVLDTAIRAYNHTDMPKGKSFVATINCGSVWTMVGFWYASMNYGYCTFSNYVSSYFIRLDNGVWSVTNLARTTSSSVNIKIGNGSTYAGTIACNGKVRTYNFYYYSDNVVGTINLTTPIGTVADVDKPKYESNTAISMYTNGDYSGTTYNGTLMINNSGQLLIRAKPAEIAACREFRGGLVWLVE